MTAEDERNTDLDQNDILLQSPALPPRNVTVQRSSAPPYVHNQNIFAVLLKNRRQITSLTAGNLKIFLLFITIE